MRYLTVADERLSRSFAIGGNEALASWSDSCVRANTISRVGLSAAHFESLPPFCNRKTLRALSLS